MFRQMRRCLTKTKLSFVGDCLMFRILLDWRLNGVGIFKSEMRMPP
jgi:hypothetical protein